MTKPAIPLAQQVKAVLLERIASGGLRPGDRVRESELAAEVGASSIPVREAIRELVAIGVLDFAPRRGAWVRKVSLQETIESLEVKAVLEKLAAKTASDRLCGKCGSLRKTVRRIVAAAKRGDFIEFQRHNHEFHRAIVAASGNRALVRTWDSLAFDVRTKFILDFLATVDPVKVAREHERIVAALDQGDARASARLLVTHSRQLIKYLNDEIESAVRAAS
ncbi:GntR family transcriptional regulator [Crateriforma conspicua]|uniref:Putative HTH-type transcriptional regulator YdfH n=1 Tax=Crateriforma conspicua TaxID=2527996 RepID=A0A5C6FSR9_9PLAN|nr:GntR family transcriptional regulator [Crateriforma conspicua]TWU64595.1 putative HTH-type transcriptional regulator YdfH [Crateriforma conspicua]